MIRVYLSLAFSLARRKITIARLSARSKRERERERERESEMHAAAAALNTLKSPGELLKNALENIAERACAYVYTRARAS